MQPLSPTCNLEYHSRSGASTSDIMLHPRVGLRPSGAQAKRKAHWHPIVQRLQEARARGKTQVRAATTCRRIDLSADVVRGCCTQAERSASTELFGRASGFPSAETSGWRQSQLRGGSYNEASPSTPPACVHSDLSLRTKTKSFISNGNSIQLRCMFNFCWGGQAKFGNSEGRWTHLNNSDRSPPPAPRWINLSSDRPTIAGKEPMQWGLAAHAALRGSAWRTRRPWPRHPALGSQSGKRRRRRSASASRRRPWIRQRCSSK